MRTDKHVYEVFEARPQWLLDLLGRTQTSRCRFQSVVLKAIERQCDGVLDFEDSTLPLIVNEWQFYDDPWIYNRVVVSMSLLQEQNPGRKVEGLIVFGSRHLDPQSAPWTKVVTFAYLDELIPELSRRSPNHPLPALFAPLMEPDDETLRRSASSCYNKIVEATDDEHVRAKMLGVFVDWIIQRFKTLGKVEIEKMLTSHLVPIEETQAGKELIAIGVEKGFEQGIAQGIGKGIEKGIEEGIEKGIEKGRIAGKIQTLQEILGESVMPLASLVAKSLEDLDKQAQLLQTKLAGRQRLD